MVEALEAGGTVEPALGMRTALLGAANRTARPDLVERLEAWIRDQGVPGLAWAQRAMAARPDRAAVLAGYDGPAVVVVGEQDEIAPPDVARAMAEALGAPLVVVPGAGHMPTVESPEPVAAALSELAGRVDADR